MKKKQDEKLAPLLPKKDHKLKTRRDFLGQGLVAGMSYSLAPSLYGLLKSNQVYGQDAIKNCGTVDTSNSKTPVIIIDLAGGGNIAGSNIMVGGQGGQSDYLSNYERLGIADARIPNGTNEAQRINSELGLKFHSDSAMLDGILQTTSAQVRAKTDGAVFCASSDNDTQNNPHNPIYWLNKAGATGSLVQTAGTKDSRSGGKSNVPSLSFDPTIAPIRIQRPEDCVGLVSLGRIGDELGPEKAQSVLRTMERMSDRKLASFSNKALPDQVKEVVGCGFDTSAFTDGQFAPDSLDARLDADIAAIYDNLNDGQQRRQASIAKMVLGGYIGAGTIEMGGYDYHNNDRNNTDGRDRNVGRAIGRILSLAAAKQSDVFIYIYSDGGISSNGNNIDNVNGVDKPRFTSDDDDRAATVMLVYKHGATQKSDIIRSASNGQLRRQLGYYNSNIAIQKSANVASNNVDNLARAVVANYLALHNEENRIDEVLGNNPFGSNLDQYLVFKG